MDYRKVGSTSEVAAFSEQDGVEKLVVGGVEQPSSDVLQMLWTQSVALRAQTLHIRALAMEARATARDLRARRMAYEQRPERKAG